ncbi:restriction endonuclease [Rummeliibacillus sp. TYF005]|uniref:restriction endonuclease n=1 Tax=Rummeliibacillus sp. TYF005 TaxID=2058214 RepID=UPI000F52610D|nr:restriction endonuclease [Rummeliibacillus sp. TYF005]RPJ94087.1 restriction endonuclease [Rummeliibacillus sp. TYF005]
MAIPTYEQFMYPFLEYLSDEREHTLKELYEYLPKVFQLTEEQIEELLPSGKQSIVVNRIGWARTYLKNAGLIDSPKRAIFRITKRGKSILDDPSIKEINDSILKKYPEFLTFKYGKNEEAEIVSPKAEELNTPLEIIEKNFNLLKHSVQHELLNKIMSCTPSFFEQLIVELLVAMGYGGSIKDAGKAVGKSGDGGIDGIIKEDVLGLDKIYLQGKRWANPVSRPDIQAFVGSLLGVKANKGVFITTSRFTKEAIEYAQNVDRSLILIDGEKLTDLMFEYNVGVSNESVLTLKKIDLDYFEEG